MIKLKDILNEEKIETKSFTEFAQTRHDGAEKIAETAKEKGGDAMLTYNHFIVKLPYYEKANAGKFDLEEGVKEYNELVKRLSDSAEKVDLGMTEFQKLVGKIEVLGELIIKGKK
jgi:DNA-binding ferritin-like protein